MTKNDFAELRNVQNEVCISVIVPMHRLSPDRRVDEMELQRAVAKAKYLVEGKYTTEITTLLKQKLDELVSSIDFLHNKDGIGLYVCPSVTKVVKFPFAVKEKVVV